MLSPAHSQLTSLHTAGPEVCRLSQRLIFAAAPAGQFTMAMSISRDKKNRQDRKKVCENKLIDNVRPDCDYFIAQNNKTLYISNLKFQLSIGIFFTRSAVQGANPHRKARKFLLITYHGEPA